MAPDISEGQTISPTRRCVRFRLSGRIPFTRWTMSSTSVRPSTSPSSRGNQTPHKNASTSKETLRHPSETVRRRCTSFMDKANIPSCVSAILFRYRLLYLFSGQYWIINRLKEHIRLRRSASKGSNLAARNADVSNSSVIAKVGTGAISR